MKLIVLITGVNGGIGLATAQIFSEAKWHVIGIDRQQTASKDSVHHYIQADVSDAAQWQRISSEIADDEGRIDALINNAAIQICKPILETTVEEWDSIMATNVRSVYLAVKNVHVLMREYGGAIVNVSSVHALATSKNIAAYAASKGALLAFTRAMAIELAADKIRVNAVLPGAVDTPMLRAGLNRGHVTMGNIEDSVCELGKKHVLGRIGLPEEIGQTILFLADSRRSSFITGQALIVDGGAMARLSTE
jgi:NAD(P)-dependent dehydrogenase (short-subunit alcohol dehydrogenase family)